MTQMLSSKESSIFKSIVKHYETKQYKKGLKLADGILKKCPNHGETLAMRGLLLHCMDKREEGFEFVRKGLKCNLKSHVCWHVYGILYRGERNYVEASKCYLNALKWDPDNMQIMRDLYLLQIQMRDLNGFVETRRKVLAARPNNRMHWIGFAVGYHLLEKRQMAIDIIDQYLDTMKSNMVEEEESSYEDSELLFYKFTLLEEMGEFEKGLELLNKEQGTIRDVPRRMEKQAECYMHLNEFEKAMALYEILLDDCSDNYRYHRGMQCCILRDNGMLMEKRRMVLPSDDVSKWTEKQFEDILMFYNRRRCKIAAKKEYIWQKIPLYFTNGDEFKNRLDRYVRIFLKRGVPSLGSQIKFLYDGQQVNVVEELLEGYAKQLKLNGQLPNRCGHLMQDEREEKPVSKEKGDEILLWTMYLLAQHYDRLKKYDNALRCIDECIERSPTTLDFLQRKGKIVKHLGCKSSAADLVDMGRKIDLADRYINNKATEYLLQADRIEQANDTIALFTKHEGDPQQNLFDMQCMWYEIEAGNSYMRTKAYPLALKKFFAVEKHFDDIEDDQFDFHSYCIRKMTIRSYVDMIRMSDTLHGHEFFKKAAHGAIQCYLAIYDQKQNVIDADSDLSPLSGAELKRAKRLQAKARKAKFREQELAKEQKAEKVVDVKKKPTTKVVVDKDPKGEIVAAKPPLQEAWRFVTRLQKFSAKDAWTHLLAFDVSFLMNKHLLSLQALYRLHKLDIQSTFLQYEFKARIVKLFVHGNSEFITAAAPVLLSHHASPESWVKSFTASSFEDHIGIAKCYFELSSIDKSAIISMLTVPKALWKNVSLFTLTNGHVLLSKVDADAAAQYKTQAANLYPKSDYFGTGFKI